MLRCIHLARYTCRHVKDPSLRSRSASHISHLTFQTNRRIHDHAREETYGEAQSVKHNDFTSQDQKVKSQQDGNGGYTSLTSNLTHYPISSPPHSAPTSTFASQPFSPPNATLSSLLPFPSPHHSSLHSFLTHSRRTHLNPQSTVFTGTRYEYLTLSCLRRLGIEVLRVGGTGDRGVDGVGWWWLPQWQEGNGNRQDWKGTGKSEGETAGDRIKVLVQCKRIAPSARSGKSIGPNVVRELEGAFRGAPAGWRGGTGSHILGILVSTRAATKGVLDSMRRSDRALAWVLLEEIEDANEPNDLEAADSIDNVEAADGSKQGMQGIQSAEAEAKVRGEAAEMKIGNGNESDHAQDFQQDENSQRGNQTTYQYRMVTGRIKQILWNQKALEMGLEGLDVVKRYGAGMRSGTDSGSQSEGGRKQETGDEVVLMWKGKVVEGLPEEE